MKTRHKMSLEMVDFARKLGIPYFHDEADDEDSHVYVEVRHNFMCMVCNEYLSREEGFVLIPLSQLERLHKKIGDKL